MSFFEVENYRNLIESYIKTQPHNGHGLKLKIARALRVHPSLITQVLKGQKTFSMEQACQLAHWMKLSELEFEYFLTLVELDRSGSKELSKFLKKKIQKIRQEANHVKSHVNQSAQLKPKDQAFFYSHWFYSAIRLATDIKECNTSELISKKLDLPLDLVLQVLDFLISKKLVVVNDDKSLGLGPQNTFLPANSPLISRHHLNWRIKAIEQHPRLKSKELAFSAPLTLSTHDFSEIKDMCLSLINRVSKKVKQSPPEQLACLNLDWFLVGEPTTSNNAPKR